MDEKDLVVNGIEFRSLDRRVDELDRAANPLTRDVDEGTGSLEDGDVVEALRVNQGDILNYLTRRVSNVDDAADLFGETYATAWRRRKSMPADAIGRLRPSALRTPKPRLRGAARTSARLLQRVQHA